MRFSYLAMFYIILCQPTYAFDLPGETPSRHNYTEAPAWKESDNTLPAYPDEDTLLKLPIEHTQAFEYFIDPASISVGDDDVVRYLILLRSRTGSKNVFFEGIRCETQEYKSYAFATGQQLHRLQSARWRLASTSGSQRYRHELMKYFLCDSGSPLSYDTIMRRLRLEESGVHDPSDIFL